MNTKAVSHIIEVCRAPGGCPNSVVSDFRIIEDLDDLFNRLEFENFLTENNSGDLKRHQQFIISISSCPNSCSRPQIADIGIVGAETVCITEKECSQCGSCVDICIENSITLHDDHGPEYDLKSCLYCGKCAKVCPEGTIRSELKGFRVMLGGKLGRHPRLATEIPGIYSREQVLNITEKSVNLFMENYHKIKRFADIFTLYDESRILDTVMN